MNQKGSFSIRHEKSIHLWDEGVPLGSGMRGCLVYGGGDPLICSLDRGDLWDRREWPIVESKDFSYAKLVECACEGSEESMAEMRRIFNDGFDNPTPTKIPAGHVELRFDDPVNVLSHLDYHGAKADISVQCASGGAEVEVYMHAVEGLGCMRIQGASRLRGIDVIAPAFSPGHGVEGGERDGPGSESKAEVWEMRKDSLERLGYAAARYESEGGFQWFVQPAYDGLEYGIVLLSRNRKRNQNDELTIFFDIAPLSSGGAWLDESKKNIERLHRIGWDDLLSSHRGWWTDFWDKSGLEIPDTSLERMWVQANYFLGSASRKGAPPMPLQGVWTADDGNLPPWQGDYHNDLNTQTTYLHYLKANHIQEGESFIDFLKGLMPQAQRFAGEFFDAPGLCLPGVMTIDGRPLGKWPMYTLGLTNQIWLCQIIERHGTFVGDGDYWKEFAYPYFSGTAECILRWLERGKDGKWYLPISSSPEMHDDTLASFLEPNSNYDLALLRYLFDRLAWMAETLEIDADASRWRAVLDDLPELAVDDEKGLMPAPNENLEESHRHMSHAMAIYPLDMIHSRRSDHERKIIDDTLRRLEVLGTGYWVGYSFAWAALLYSRRGNGEAARYRLRTFYENTCSPNGFHLNGDYRRRGVCAWHYRPFTLEGNMLGADALQEMLLQDFDGVIRVFPAIPESWAEEGASFRGFRVRGGFLVSAAIQNGELEYIDIDSERGGRISLENGFSAEKLNITADGGESTIRCAPSEVFQISTEEGRHYRVRRL